MEEDILFFLDDIAELLESIQESLRASHQNLDEDVVNAIVEDLTDVRARLERIELDLQ